MSKIKTETKLELLGIAVTIIVAIWLSSRPSTLSGVAPTSTSGPVVVPPTVLPGGITYGGGTYNLSAPVGGNNLSVGGLGSGGSGNGCCSSCGCDPGSAANQFAASISSALNNYAQSIANSEQQYQTAAFGELPSYVTQYFATADPTARSGLNG